MQQTKLADYDIYSHNYKAGSSTSIFIGPIWLEEVISVQLSSGSGDIPAYGYSNPYFDRLMIGRYIVQGTITIPYTEPDSLLRIIEAAKESTIQDNELLSIIENQKSIFSSTLKNKFINEQMLKDPTKTIGEMDKDGLFDYMETYVERICREVELQSLDGKFSPRDFELTIVRGNIYDRNSSIDIYQKVKIVGTSTISAPDDSGQIEVYSFTGQRKPPRVSKKTVRTPDHELSRDNLMRMAKELASKLVDSLMEPPVINVFAPEQRTSLMYSTDKLAIAGLLSTNARFFGKNSSFIEMTYGFEYPEKFNSAINPKKDYSSDTNLFLFTKELGIVKQTESSIKLISPSVEEGNVTFRGFDNRYGKIISVNGEKSAEHVYAVGPVEPATLMGKQLGGTIVLPRHRRNNMDIGSFIPPNILAPESVNYSDTIAENLKVSTMWNCLLGYRAIANTGKTVETNTGTGDYINQVSQPLHTFAYIDSLTAEYNTDPGSEVKAKLIISVPVYIDFIGLEKTNTYAKRSKDKLKCSESDKKIEISIKQSGETSKDVTSTKELKESEKSIYMDAIVNVAYQNVELAMPIEDMPDDDPLQYKPYFFRINMTNHSQRMATDFNKCLYITPIIFFEKNIVGVQHGDTEDTIIYQDEVLPGNSPEENLAYLLSKGSIDDSCNIDFFFDWVVSGQSGYMTQGNSLIIDGVFFANKKKGGVSEYISCSQEGCTRKVKKEYNKIHVFWVSAVIPINRSLDAVDDKQEIDIVHDLEAPSGRYLEIYNIIRCDILQHGKILYENYNPTDSIIREIWNKLVYSFKELINVFTNIDYYYPVRKSMERVAGYVNGYACNINIDEIVNQVMAAEFTDKINIPQNVKNLREAFLVASGEYVAKESTDDEEETKERPLINPDLYFELFEAISLMIREKSEINNSIISFPSENICQIEREVITPASDVVTWSLTKEGYEELSSIKDYNIANIISRRDSETVVPAVSIELGGYDE